MPRVTRSLVSRKSCSISSRARCANATWAISLAMPSCIITLCTHKEQTNGPERLLLWYQPVPSVQPSAKAVCIKLLLELENHFLSFSTANYFQFPKCLRICGYVLFIFPIFEIFPKFSDLFLNSWSFSWILRIFPEFLKFFLNSSIFSLSSSIFFSIFSSLQQSLTTI